MKFALPLFFLTAALPALASVPQPKVTEAFFNGELCGAFEHTRADFHPFKRGDVTQGALMVLFAGKLVGRAADEQSATCEATVKIEYPKGYRFHVMFPTTSGLLEAGSNVRLDTHLEIRTGSVQFQSYHHAVRGDDTDGTSYDVLFGEPLNGKELRSDCSGSAEIVFTNTATMAPIGRLNPGEIDDISMAFTDRSTAMLVLERCAQP